MAVSSSSATADVPGLRLYRNIVHTDLSRRIRRQLLNEHRHHRSEIVIDNERHRAPRLTSSYSDAPLSMDGMETSQPWSRELAMLRDTIARRFGLTFNYALANLYRDGSDFTGWHCDKAWLHEPGSQIAIISFGATRTLAVRPVGRNDAAHHIPLPESSVILMDLALQATHEHCILAETDDVDRRLSITLRRIRILPEYLDSGRQRRRPDGVPANERNEASAVYR